MTGLGKWQPLNMVKPYPIPICLRRNHKTRWPHEKTADARLPPMVPTPVMGTRERAMWRVQ